MSAVRFARPALRAARPAMRPMSISRAPLPIPALRAAPPRAFSTAVGLRATLRPLPRTLGRRFNSSSSSSSAAEKPKSAYERFKDLTKTYGSYAIIMYLALSAVDFTLSFMVVHAVGAEHIEPGVKKIVHWYRVLRHGEAGAAALDAADKAQKIADAAEEAADKVLGRQQGWWENKALWAEITLAYAIHKVGLLPVRAGLTVAWTPKVVNFLRRRGWIGASGAKRAAQHGADKMRDASQRAVDAAKDAVNK